MTHPLPPSSYYWLSLTGAMGLAAIFGLALPTLFVRVVQEVSWAKPGRSAGLLTMFWLLSMGGAWGYDAYCQLFKLTSHQPVLLFLNVLFLSGLVAAAFAHYRKLNRVVSRSEIEREQYLLRMVQEVSRGGFFKSRPSASDPSKWVVESANRAACTALGYNYLTLFDNGMVGLTGEQVVAPDFLDQARKHAGQPEKSEYMIQLMAKDGRRAWVEMAGQTLTKYPGGPVRISYFNVVTPLIERIEEQRDKLLLAGAVQELTQHVKRLTHESA